MKFLLSQIPVLNNKANKTLHTYFSFSLVPVGREQDLSLEPCDFEAVSRPVPQFPQPLETLPLFYETPPIHSIMVTFMYMRNSVTDKVLFAH